MVEFLRHPEALPTYYAKPGMKFCYLGEIEKSVVCIDKVMGPNQIRVVGNNPKVIIIPYLSTMDSPDTCVIIGAQPSLGGSCTP